MIRSAKIILAPQKVDVIHKNKPDKNLFLSAKLMKQVFLCKIHNFIYHFVIHIHNSLCIKNQVETQFQIWKVVSVEIWLNT